MLPGKLYSHTEFCKPDYRWWGEDHGEVLHQTFSQEWAALNREVVEESGKLGEIMYWMRSGGVNSKIDQVNYY